MRTRIFSLMLLPFLLVSSASPALAARKARAKSSARSQDYKYIPAFNWGIMATGFVEIFKNRNMEIESAAPGRYFPGVVAFALRRIDGSGHFLMLNCGSGDACAGKLIELEDRVVYSALLEAVNTPKVSKDDLYDPVTWKLTALGEKYMGILRKRYPDFSRRLGGLIGASFPER